MSRTNGTCPCRVVPSDGLPCSWKSPFGPEFLGNKSSSAKMTAYFLVWFSTMFSKIHCGVTLDKVELTFDMCIARPHPKTPLRFFDVCFRRLESKICARGIWHHVVQFSATSSARAKQTAKHSWELVVIPPTLHNNSSLPLGFFCCFFPVFWYVFGPQDSEIELCKLM